MKEMRYSIISLKNKREIILLKGRGCQYKGCRYCDYYLDGSSDVNENFIINKKVIDKVSGLYQRLEVINSGSFCDLDNQTMDYLINKVESLGINDLIFECNYQDSFLIKDFKEKLNKININAIFKIGLETFDYDYRENYLNKGIKTKDIKDITINFEQCCLLFGLPNQSIKSMVNDIELGLMHFNRICINIMNENTTSIKPDETLIKSFIDEIYPLIKDNERIDILLDNNDFGVGL